MKKHIFSLLTMFVLLAFYSAITNLSISPNFFDQAVINHVAPVARLQTNDGMKPVSGDLFSGWGDPVGREIIAQGWGDPIGRESTVLGWGDPIG